MRISSLLWFAPIGLTLHSCLLTDPLDEAAPARDTGGMAGSDPHGTAGETGQGGQDPMDTPCQRCLRRACSSETANCTNNADCVNLLSCFVECGADEFCQDACVAAYEDGVEGLSALFDCMDLYCTEECI